MEKKKVIDLIEQISDFCEKNGINTPNSLKMAKDYFLDKKYKVGIIGKIKTGKSTLINCFIGQDLLPRRVTVSTAAVTIIEPSDKPSISYEDINGKKSFVDEFDTNLIQNLILAKDFKEDELISTVYLKFPFNFINNIILVDTPGIDDTSEWRVDKVLSILKELDIAIVLIKHPLSKAIINFLTENVIKNDYKKLFFCLTFIDHFENEKELKKVIDDTALKLEQILNYRPIIYPIAPKLILADYINNKKKPKELVKLENTLKQFIQSNESKKLKLDRTFLMIYNSLNEIKLLLNFKLDLLIKDINEFEKEIEAKKSVIEKIKVDTLEMKEFVYDRFTILKNQVAQSLKKLSNEIKTEVELEINGFSSSDFSILTEALIPRLVKRYLKDWETRNLSVIEQFTKEIQKKIISSSSKLENDFNKLFSKDNHSENISQEINRIGRTLIENSNQGFTLVNIGAFILGLFTHQYYLLVAPLLFDRLLGISQKLQKKRKETLRPIILEKLDITLSNYSDLILTKIDNLILEFNRIINENYELKLKDFEKSLKEIEKKRSLSKDKREVEEINLKNNVKLIVSWENQIKALLNIDTKNQ